MAPFDPVTWAWWTWVMHAVGVYYVVEFFRHFFRFRRLERAAADGDPEAVDAFNRALRGFPGAGFAKMLGKKRLEIAQERGP